MGLDGLSRQGPCYNEQKMRTTKISYIPPAKQQLEAKAPVFSAKKKAAAYIRVSTNTLEQQTSQTPAILEGTLNKAFERAIKRRHDRNKYGRHFWVRGYYVETVGQINEEIIEKYIEEQEESSRIEG